MRAAFLLRLSFAFAAVVSFTALTTLNACSHDCEDTSTCPTADGGDATVDGGGGDGPIEAPANCDLGKDPKDSPACVDDSVGIFVSVNGNDADVGSKAKPVKTLAKALSILGAKPRVYVCEGTYTASVDVGVSVAIFGALKCDWTPGGNAVVAADKSAYAIKVTATNASLTDIEVLGKPGTAAGESSIGIFAANANGLRLRRAKVTAGAGVTATQPATTTDFSTRAPDGDGGTAGAGGAAVANNCTNGSGSSTGNLGGAPASGGQNGGDGVPNTYPVNPTGSDGLGGVKGGTCSAGAGHDGSYGPGGGAGNGAAKLGTLAATGWTGEPGGTGGVGKVGQGAGGGASLGLSGGGGGGGSGGCGGEGGKGGTPGGSSIGLLLFMTSASIESSDLIAKDAGDGAKGGTGQKAQEGGYAGNPGPTACIGGYGAHGGSGGGGGGGSGGLSLGIGYAGTPPKIDGTDTPDAVTLPKVTIGKAGSAGAAGDGAPAFKTTSPVSNGGANGTPGIAGKAQAVLAL